MPLEFPWVMLALALLLPAAGLVLMLRARKRHAIQPPPEAIVVLLREPAVIEPREMADAFSRAAGCEVTVAGPIPQRRPSDRLPPGNWLWGEAPHFLVQTGTTLFLVNLLEARYISDPDAPPWSLAPGEVRDAVAAHTAWLSAEILHPESVSLENYRIVGRVLANFTGENCLVLFHPPLNRFALYTYGTEASLRSDMPVQAVFGG